MATILVADDDAATRLLVRTLLEHRGHTVVEAADGSSALAAAALHLPDLILLDLSMRPLGGAEFMRELRADPLTHSLAVALYTATTMTAALRDFMEIYAIGSVVPKPCEPPELLAAVVRALALKRPL
jgi:CheY-like chemotaxis protein